MTDDQRDRVVVRFDLSDVYVAQRAWVPDLFVGP